MGWILDFFFLSLSDDCGAHSFFFFFVCVCVYDLVTSESRAETNDVWQPRDECLVYFGRCWYTTPLPCFLLGRDELIDREQLRDTFHYSHSSSKWYRMVSFQCGA